MFQAGSAAWRCVLNSSLEGRIDVRIALHGKQAAIQIASSRPRLARKLMTGATPKAAAERAGLIFSLCGKAQRIAAEMACEAAQDIVPDDAVLAARTQRVIIELAQEHVWQLMVNWPRLMSLQPDMQTLLGLRQSAQEPAAFMLNLQAVLRDVLLGVDAEQWLRRDLRGFDDWRAQARTLPARLFGAWSSADDHGIRETALLPPLHQLSAAHCVELAQQALADEDFCGQPQWQGRPAETGAIARQCEHPLIDAWIDARGRGAGARQLARLVELAGLPQQLHALSKPLARAYALAENVGMSAIETSRGLLIHVVRLADGLVADYRIVAPTEWNFHPAGALAEALAALSPAADVATRAREVCQSLDPCVAFGVELSHA
jgi:uptake hydrogenase large subunit